MADKVYTSAEFKRERDNFHVGYYYSTFIWFLNLSKSNLKFSKIWFKNTWIQVILIFSWNFGLLQTKTEIDSQNDTHLVGAEIENLHDQWNQNYSYSFNVTFEPGSGLFFHCIKVRQKQQSLLLYKHKEDWRTR